MLAQYTLVATYSPTVPTLQKSTTLETNTPTELTYDLDPTIGKLKRMTINQHFMASIKKPEELPLNEKLKKFAPSSPKNTPSNPAKIEKFDANNKYLKTLFTTMNLRFVKYPEDLDTPELRLAEIAEHYSGRAANLMKAIVIGDREDLLMTTPSSLHSSLEPSKTLNTSRGCKTKM